MFTKIKSLYLALLAAGSVFVFSIVPAFATPATVDDVWAAASLDGISEKVIALLIAIIGIKLLFVAGKMVNVVLSRVRG